MAEVQAKTGVDFLLYVADVPVAGQRNASLSRTAETIDASYKGSGGWASSIAGQRSWSISTDAIYVPDDSSLKSLETAFTAGTPVTVSIKDSAGGWTGKAYITDLSIEYPMDDVLTVSIELVGNGALSPVAGE